MLTDCVFYMVFMYRRIAEDMDSLRSFIVNDFVRKGKKKPAAGREDLFIQSKNRRCFPVWEVFRMKITISIAFCNLSSAVPVI